MFCTRARSCARAYDVKIVRSRDAQCKPRESPSNLSSFFFMFKAICERIYNITRVFMTIIIFFKVTFQFYQCHVSLIINLFCQLPDNYVH